MKRLMVSQYIVLIFTILFCLPVTAISASPNGGWDATWSPDDAHIAFTSGSLHNVPNLWVAKSDGSEMREITRNGAHEPIWQPGSKTIVFGTLRAGVPEYMSIHDDGPVNSEAKFPRLPAGADNPVFSPDGTMVAYGLISKDGTSNDLWVAHVNDSDSKKLTGLFWVRKWAWSPNGTTLAFVVGRASGSSVWTVSLAHKGLKLLYKGFCSAPAYSPKGDKLAIAIPDVTSGFKIDIIDLKTGAENTIPVKTFDGTTLMWSPDGTRLYFESNPMVEHSIWTVQSDGKGLARLTPKDLLADKPVLSSDGLKIVFQGVTKKSYSPDLYVCDSSGKNLRQLTFSRPSYWSPIWSPNGKKLAYKSDVDHKSKLFVAYASGKHRQSIITLMSPTSASISWYPDNNRLLVADAWQMATVTPAGKKTRLSPFKSLRAPAQSPVMEGKNIFYMEWHGQNAGISVMKIDGTDARALTDKPSDRPKATPQPKTMQQCPANIKQPVSAARIAGVKKGVLVASTKFYVPENVVAQSPTPAQPAEKPATKADKKADPHAGLGLMGPIPDIHQDQPKPVIDSFPAVSPDGKFVAFIRSGQVWVVDSEGKNARQITQFKSDPGEKNIVSSVTWSPSGDQILSLTLTARSDAMKLAMWLSNPSTGDTRLLYSENVGSEFGVFYGDCTNPPAFTRDGKNVIFTSISGDSPRIASLDIGSDSLRVLVPTPSSFASLDPSGKMLAYVDLSDSVERIRILNQASGEHIGRLLFR